MGRLWAEGIDPGGGPRKVLPPRWMDDCTMDGMYGALTMGTACLVWDACAVTKSPITDRFSKPTEILSTSRSGMVELASGLHNVQLDFQLTSMNNLALRMKTIKPY